LYDGAGTPGRKQVDSAEVVRADNPVAIGEAQADLGRLADLRNQAAWGLREPTVAADAALVSAKGGRDTPGGAA
jgi:hypothetical protein